MKNVIVVASPHKVGSTWLYNMLVAAGFNRSKAPEKLRKNKHLGLIDLGNPDTFPYLSEISEKSIFKSHSFPPAEQIPENVLLVSLIRDPRDLLVSKMFHTAKLPEHVGGHSELQGLSSDERLEYLLVRDGGEIRLLQSWFDFDSRILIKYEDLLREPIENLELVLKEASCHLNSQELKSVVDRCSFNKMKNDAPDSRKYFFRKGVSGDWKNYFNSRTIDLFKNSMGGRWNEFLVSSGYEKDELWDL